MQGRKITPDEASDIRFARVQERMSIAALADRFGVAKSSVSVLVKDIPLSRDEVAARQRTVNHGRWLNVPKEEIPGVVPAAREAFNRLSTKAKGDVGVASVMTALLKRGRRVLVPFGDNDRYDLVIDDDGAFSRVQCKCGIIVSGSVQFSSSSSYAHRGNSRKLYSGEVEFFGVYCPDNGTTYFVPAKLCTKGATRLRLVAKRNGCRRPALEAAAYVI